MNWALIAVFIHITILVIFIVRVVSRDLSVGVTLAWLAIFLLLPYLGPAAYLLLGESQFGKRRAQRAKALMAPMSQRLESLGTIYPAQLDSLSPCAQQIERLARVVKGAPATRGNRVTVLATASCAFEALIKDIDSAKRSVHLLFYIWSDGGMIDDIASALIRARERGVECRLLMDAVGSRPFFSGEGIKKLRAAGVEVTSALPVALWRVSFQRLDLRNHRKIAVIDGKIGYTGSLNLADPKVFKQNANVGEWVDVMTRVEGPVAEALNLMFVRDWEMETGIGVEAITKGHCEKFSVGEGASIQVIPSGPDVPVNAIHELILMLIYSARDELILTSPYFVPTDMMITALVTAAFRGVRVTLVVPEKNDSKMVRFASESTYQTLCEAGVQIARFQGGLLHAKTITVDRSTALIGSVNMDMRSFFINFEVSLLIYDESIVDEIRYLQRSYLNASTPIDLAEWARRPLFHRFLEKTVRLAGPLL